MDYHYLLSFHSTHKALRAEGLLKAGEVAFRLLPAPKELAAYCALVLGVDGAKNLQLALDLLSAKEAPPEDIFKKEGSTYVKM